MENQILTNINNMLINSSNTQLTIYEVSYLDKLLTVLPVSGKDYFDLAMLILNKRKASQQNLDSLINLGVSMAIIVKDNTVVASNNSDLFIME